MRAIDDVSRDLGQRPEPLTVEGPEPFRSRSAWRWLARLGEIPTAADAWEPGFSIELDERDILIRIELPGVRHKDVMLSIMGDTLTVRANTKYQDVEEPSRWRFLRQLRLPVAVDGERAEAHLEHGVLEVRLPRQVPASRRRIEVR